MRNFGYNVTSVRPPAQTLGGGGGGGEAGQPLGTGLIGQFSLSGNCVETLHLLIRVFLAGNHISDEQRDKEQGRAREKRPQNLTI